MYTYTYTCVSISILIDQLLHIACRSCSRQSQQAALPALVAAAAGVGVGARTPVTSAQKPSWCCSWPPGWPTLVKAPSLISQVTCCSSRQTCSGKLFGSCCFCWLHLLCSAGCVIQMSMQFSPGYCGLCVTVMTCHAPPAAGQFLCVIAAR